MRKNYLKPEMELTECVMMQTAICSGETPTQGNTEPGNTTAPESWPTGAPKKRVF